MTNRFYPLTHDDVRDPVELVLQKRLIAAWSGVKAYVDDQSDD